MKTINLLILLGVLLLLLSCNNEKENTESVEAKNEVAKWTLDLTEANISVDDIEFYELGKKDVKLKKAVPGIAQSAPNYISYIAAPMDGIVSALYLNEGERVKKGQVIMEIESLEYGNLLSEFLKSSSEYEYQQGRLDRNNKLLEKGITSQSDMEMIQADFELSKANFVAVKTRLMTLGLDSYEIENLKNSENIEPHLMVRARISGVIDQHYAELGMPVKAYDRLASIVDPTQLLIKGYLSPEDLNFVAAGDSVVINRQSDNTVGAIISTIASINPALDENSRSLIANIYVEGNGSWPLPGENLRLEIYSETPENLLAVPVSAISWLGEDAILYVFADENTLEIRKVEIASSDDTYSFISSGVSEGELVAISEIFTLKSLVRYNEFAE
ncbi:MAG TPA: efflux RND transporter periplasmic adaptor subunit [Bacteroidales bacterium]|nr:efflux RND transporter periplasmic adaptor subunit [Bacteroidales bacterium]HXK82355.1 efflux RND transporter periplasmic adaptor subunit [Bacteroidales bacterium]